MTCTVCSKRSYSAYCVAHKPRKPIAVTSVPKRSKRPKQIGKGTLKYNEWRDTVARPYLIATFGEVCAESGCLESNALDIDHIENRGSHPELKMTLSNVQFLCRPHHAQKTDHINPDGKKEVTT
jgi:5-methylcytosine-specific restriction endonuclease McrA